MARVLHLLSKGCDFQTRRSVAALARGLENKYKSEVWTIGGGGNFRNSFFAALALRRVVLDGQDVVHAWDAAALSAARFARVRRIVFTLPEIPVPRALYHLNRHRQFARLHVCCSGSSQYQFYARHGFPVDRLHQIYPPLDLAHRGLVRNLELRNALGFAAGERVILTVGESTRDSGHREAIWTAGILRMLDPRYKVLMWGRGEYWSRCIQIAEKIRQPEMLTIAEAKLGRSVEFEELPSAADVVLFAPAGPTPGLPMAMCVASGLPMVGHVVGEWSEMLSNLPGVVCVPRRSPRLLAQAIIDLPEPDHRSAETAIRPTVVADRFSNSRFVEHYSKIYAGLQ